MDPTKDQSVLDLTEDPNCHVHFVASDLPEPLPSLDLIENKYSTRPPGTSSRDKCLRLSKTSQYWVKRYRAGNRMEGWTMLYLKKMTSIPVPTVYAILTNKEKRRDIILMEYIPHESLEKTWPTLQEAEKEDTAKQLAAYLTELRALPSIGFFGCSLPAEFGNLDRMPLPDFLFTGQDTESTATFDGPFDTIEQLTKGLSGALGGNTGIDLDRRKLYQRLMPMIIKAESRPVFTHGDIQLRNIIRKKDGQVVMIDWGLCGWYPEWWEYCYALYAADFRTNWPAFIPKFLSEFPNEFLIINTLRNLWIGGGGLV